MGSRTIFALIDEFEVRDLICVNSGVRGQGLFFALIVDSRLRDHFLLIMECGVTTLL